MITYVSLFLSLVAAVVGVLVSPRKKLPDGHDVLSSWAWVFILFPIVGFGVSGWSTYQDHAKAAVAQQRADREASESKAAASLAQQKLDELRTKMKDSIERIDILEVGVKFRIPGREMRWTPDAIKHLHSFDDIYSASYEGQADNLFGLDSQMFNGWRNVTNVERVLYGDVQKALRPMAKASGGFLFLRHSVEDDFRAIIKKVLKRDFVGVHIELKELPPDVTVYPIDNPGLSRPVPSMPTVAAADDWIIFDKNSDSPEVHVLWSNRLANRRNASLNSVQDFREVQAVVYIPKPNPNLDGAPGFGAYGEPFGDLATVDFDAGGMHWGWNQNMKTSLDVIKIGRNRGSDNATESDVGFLAELQLGQRGTLSSSR